MCVCVCVSVCLCFLVRFGINMVVTSGVPFVVVVRVFVLVALGVRFSSGAVFPHYVPHAAC